MPLGLSVVSNASIVLFQNVALKTYGRINTFDSLAQYFGQKYCESKTNYVMWIFGWKAAIHVAVRQDCVTDHNLFIIMSTVLLHYIYKKHVKHSFCVVTICHGSGALVFIMFVLYCMNATIVVWQNHKVGFYIFEIVMVNFWLWLQQRTVFTVSRYQANVWPSKRM